MTRDELIALIDEKVSVTADGEEGYEQAANNLADTTTAAFNYAASQLGVTGFQAGWAALKVYGDVMHVDGPYGILKGEDLLYPQYDLHQKLAEMIERWAPWAAEQARERLTGDTSHVHPDVLAHWQRLAEVAP